METLDAQGVIVHMAQAVVEGNSHFYVKLEGDESIYDFARPGLIEIVGYQEGDVISFAYLEPSPPSLSRASPRPDGSVVEASGEPGLHQ